MPLGANKAAIMGVAGVSVAADVVLLSSQTASSDATIDFESDIDSTYGEYIFGFYNLHPSADGPYFGFQCNASGQSGYNETISSTFYSASNTESLSYGFSYGTSWDQAQGTATQWIGNDTDNDADSSFAGILHIFNPASTTYAKHFQARTTLVYNNVTCIDAYTGGYINVTAAITNVQFKFGSGNIDSGIIKMWVVK